MTNSHKSKTKNSLSKIDTNPFENNLDMKSSFNNNKDSNGNVDDHVKKTNKLELNLYII